MFTAIRTTYYLTYLRTCLLTYLLANYYLPQAVSCGYVWADGTLRRRIWMHEMRATYLVGARKHRVHQLRGWVLLAALAQLILHRV